MTRKSLALAFCAVFVAACSDGAVGSGGKADVGGGRDAQPDMASGNEDVRSDGTGGRPSDGGPGGSGGSVPEPDAAPPPGEFGAPCTDGLDCLSGYCVPAPSGERVCTERCGTAEDCPTGWSCDPVGNSGADRDFICIAERHVPCLPCRTDADCGSGQDLCLQIGASTYCGQNCERAACPEGFDCRDVTDGMGEVVSRQCQPTSDTCKPCIDPDGDGYGLGEDCAGIDCDETDTSVNAGATEICDAIDNDCDSVPDDGVIAPENFACLAVGVCEGTSPACRAGMWMCPYPEDTYEADLERACDTLDNDCDGEADDDFDFDNDPTHCGACGVVCGFPNAAPACVIGRCALAACFGGFWNVDGNEANGCEYACNQTNEGVEQCDGIDNNCDGLIDESFDLQTDVQHCGRCGSTCEYLNGVPRCDRGECALDQCEPGYVDANGDAADGCEYVCAPTNEGVEVCDSVDNDCDGVVDDGFDLQSDIGHCGACGRTCAYGDAAALCTDGLCRMGDCSPGFWDVDRRSENGCEYACQLTRNGQEICDGLDNDCDGVVDNGFDLDIDPFNCGGCSILCEFSHAGALCVGGSCTMAACDLGFVDADLDAGNGCEYACTPDADPTEQCDERDNDCDGRVDETFDLSSDVDHCGACDTPCRPASARGECVEGQCGILRCEDGHHDLDGDPENGCEYACAGNGGGETCDGVDNDCDGAVDEDFDLGTDASNCGRCGNACGFDNAGASCQAGTCRMEACNAGFWDLRNGELDGCEYACGLTLGGNEACDRIDNDCDGIVDDGYDLQTDVEHCGTCETRCAFDNAEASCQAGACRLGACLGGFLNQNGDAADGCEYGCSPSNGGVERCDGVDNDCDRQVDETFDLTTDVNNCGACGAVCRFADAAASCVARSCRMGACDPGHVDLNGLSEDGCEYACSVANGGIELCNRRDDDCDGTIDETFDLSVDLANCGACGVACAYDFGVPVCDRGTCELAACTANHWDLDGLPGNGCEYACAPTNGGVEVCDGIDNDCDGGGDEGFDLDTDVAHCGGCGNRCDLPYAIPACDGGDCIIATCAAGRVDLNGQPDDGCEYACTRSNDGNEICDTIDNDCDGVVDDGFDLTSDPAHCGRCGTSCARPNTVFACQASACVFNGCAVGWWNLDGDYANGCEYRCNFVSAADIPDPAGVDANCDGIDGIAANAVFVASNGDNQAAGTRGAPLRTIGAGVTLAASRGAGYQVLVASGNYTEEVVLSNGIGVFGGYNRAQNWARSIVDNPTIINGNPRALVADGITLSTEVQGFTLNGATPAAAGASSYAVVVRNSNANLVLSNCTVNAGNGAAGTAGSDGANGSNGNLGGVGALGGDGSSNGGNGGTAGSSSCNAGGAGGRGGYDGANSTPGGQGGGGTSGGAAVGTGCSIAGRNGSSGNSGAAGADGSAGNGAGSIAAGVWLGSPGGAGANGTHGAGGGGASGGGGTTSCTSCNGVPCDLFVGCVCNADRGGGGGGGGGAGCRGTAATGGTAGGGSFGIFIVGGNPVVRNTTVRGGRGGGGGAGGRGGTGGTGAGGGGGGGGPDDAGDGGVGGRGGNGGRGGHGGGGGGGVSYCIYRASGAVPTLTNNSMTAGNGGAGGASNGNAGVSGNAGQLF
jgi:hypothetical protein